MSCPSSPSDNALLAALHDADLRHWLPELEAVNLRKGDMLFEPGQTPNHVVFPTTAIVSLRLVLMDGGSSEIAAVGHEGLVGVSLFMGGQSSSSQAVVQSAGQAFRLRAQIAQATFNAGGPTTMLLLRYTQALLAQISQSAACNRFHTLDRQLCRCLLHSLDHSRDNELLMTHELIANRLGVRREGVTEGAFKLQQAGLIRYARGRIEVLDRLGLEERSCECYGVIKNEYDRLLPELATHEPCDRAGLAGRSGRQVVGRKDSTGHERNPTALRSARANELAKRDNPRMDDEQIAFAIQRMKERKVFDDSDAARLGAGVIAEARRKATYDFRAQAGLLQPETEWKKAFTTG